MQSEETFLQKLEQEAALQAQLERQRFLPRQLDVATAFVGKYAWQVMVVLSLVSAVLLEIV